MPTSSNFVTFSSEVKGLIPQQLQGFFHGWKNKPSSEKLKHVLMNSDEVVIATDRGSGMVVGFITAITDKTLSAYIPFLEVLPHYQKRGIGSELLRQMLVKLEKYYMVDLTCDTDKVSFYERFGLKPLSAMSKRNSSA